MEQSKLTTFFCDQGDKKPHLNDLSIPENATITAVVKKEPQNSLCGNVAPIVKLGSIKRTTPSNITDSKPPQDSLAHAKLNLTAKI